MMGTATRERMHEPRERIQEGAESIEAPADGLWRYGKWQLRDFAMQRAPIMLLIAVLMLYPLVAGRLSDSVDMRRFVREMGPFWLYVMFGVLGPLGTFLATRGIVSEDRQQGYHRFLFAKPVRLMRFYAQKLGLGFAGYAGVLAIVALLFTIVFGAVPLAPAFVPAIAFFVLFGGVTFFFSTLSRLDWVWTIGSVAAAAWTSLLVHERRWTLLAPLEWVLPPVRAFADMVGKWLMLVRPDLAPVASVSEALAATVWPVAYGVLAFGAGLWILKKRSVVR